MAGSGRIRDIVGRVDALVNRFDAHVARKDTSGFEQGSRNMAQRMVNAEEGFLQVLMDLGGINKSEAMKVLGVFRKAKVLKMDPVGGRMSVKHGAYLNPDVIKRALESVG